MIKILLVEDNDLSRKMMFYTFKRINLFTDEAVDGFEAVKKSCQKSYDVVLMDLFMPGIDGYEATSQIREWERVNDRKPVVIIGLTGNVYDGERQKCISAGMDEYMEKPFDMDVFRHTLSKFNLSL